MGAAQVLEREVPPVAKAVHALMVRAATTNAHVKRHRHPKHGDGFTVPFSIARFVREVWRDQHCMSPTELEVDLVRKYLRRTGNVVALEPMEGTHVWKVFVAAEWEDVRVVPVHVVHREPDAIDRRAARLDPSEVGEDREPGPVEVRKVENMEPDDVGVLGETQATLLVTLANHGGSFVDEKSGNASSDLAKAADLGPASSNSSSLQRLEEKGLIKRRVNAKRTYEVTLTDRGWEVAKDVNRWRSNTEVLADYLAKAGAFQHGSATKFSRVLGGLAGIDHRRVTDAIKALEERGSVTVERTDGGYYRSVKWANGNRPDLAMGGGGPREVSRVLEEDVPKGKASKKDSTPQTGSDDAPTVDRLVQLVRTAFEGAVGQEVDRRIEERRKESDESARLELIREAMEGLNAGTSPLRVLADIEEVLR